MEDVDINLPDNQFEEYKEISNQDHPSLKLWMTGTQDDKDAQDKMKL